MVVLIDRGATHNSSVFLLPRSIYRFVRWISGRASIEGCVIVMANGTK